MHTAGSRPASYPPAPPGPSPQDCSQGVFRPVYVNTLDELITSLMINRIVVYAGLRYKAQNLRHLTFLKTVQLYVNLSFAARVIHVLVSNQLLCTMGKS